MLYVPCGASAQGDFEAALETRIALLARSDCFCSLPALLL